LPSLDRQVAKAQTSNKKRLVVVYFPNGAAADYWPANGQGAGDAWSLSPILAPLAQLKRKMITFSNLENYSCMRADPFVEPSHARCAGAFLTCADSDRIRKELGVEPANAVSVDQLIAAQLGAATVLPSLQVGLSTLNSFADGRHGSLSRSISWKSATEPLYKEVNPQSVFERLIAAGAGKGGVMDAEAEREAQRRRALKKSALDAILDSTRDLMGRLAGSDRERLDRFLSSVRDLERRVAMVGTQMPGANACGVVARPGESYGVGNVPDGYDRGTHADLMNDLIVMALECDVTRVVTHMLDDARSDFVYDHLQNRVFTAAGSSEGKGAVGGFHGLQHAGDSNNGYATINHWFSTKVCELAQRLESIAEGDGTMLDNTVIMYAGSMHGSNHDANELPVVLLGGGGGVLRTDQHVVFAPTPGDRPLRDLYYTLLRQVFSLDVASFGESVTGAQNALISEVLS
jgi:hypothetical protein